MNFMIMIIMIIMIIASSDDPIIATCTVCGHGAVANAAVSGRRRGLRLRPLPPRPGKRGGGGSIGA